MVAGHSSDILPNFVKNGFGSRLRLLLEFNFLTSSISGIFEKNSMKKYGITLLLSQILNVVPGLSKMTPNKAESPLGWLMKEKRK
jgi:hypothetical protein